MADQPPFNSLTIYEHIDGPLHLIGVSDDGKWGFTWSGKRGWERWAMWNLSDKEVAHG